MNKVFGEHAIQEKIIIRNTLIIYSTAFSTRLISFIALMVFTTFFSIHYDDNFVLLQLTFLISWTISDLVPVCYLFKIHHNNFIEFEALFIFDTDEDFT